MGNNFSRSLAEAAVSGDLQRLDDLLLSSAANVLRKADPDGWTAIHYAAAAGDGAAVALLLSHEEARMATARRAKDGSTPLHLAASAGASSAVLELLKAGAEEDALDDRGRSPLAVAAVSPLPPPPPPSEEAGAESGSSGSGGSSSGAVISALVGAGADAKRALPVRIAQMQKKRAKAAFACFFLFTPRCPLCLSLSLSVSPVSFFLLVYNVNFQRQDGTTPLHLAAIRGNAPAVAALLAAPGVSCKTAASKSLRTPLHEAAASGSVECVRLLLKAGADPRAQGSDGKTPASVALDAGNGKLAVELAEGIRNSTGPGWWSAAAPSRSKEKTLYPALHGTLTPSPYASNAPAAVRYAAPQQKQQKTAAQLALEKEWGGADASSFAPEKKPHTAALAAAADAAFGEWADSALAPPPPPVASRVAAALAALSATATDAAAGAAAASRAAAASAASAAAAVTAVAAGAAVSARASLKAAAAARAEESVEGVPTAPMGAVKSVYEVDAQLRATFAEMKKEKKEVKEKEEAEDAASVAAPASASVSAVASPPPPQPLLPSLDFGTLALATHGFGEASRIGGSVRGVTFAGALPDGTKIAVKVLDPATAPPGSALAGLLLKATGGYEEEEEASSSSSSAAAADSIGVLDRPIAVGPTSRAIVTRLAEGGSLDSALRGAPRLSWAERLDLLSQVAAVLSRLHSKGLAHGSVGATNVLLDPAPAAATGKGTKWRARVSGAGVASLMTSEDAPSSPSSSAAEDTAALGTMVLQALCGAEAAGLVASVSRLVGEGEGEEGGRSASSLAERALMEIDSENKKKKRKKKEEEEDKDRSAPVVVPGASRAVSLALDCVKGSVSAEEAARVLSELAEGVRSGELLLEEEKKEEEAKAAGDAAVAAAAVATPVAVAVEQPEGAASAPSFLEDYEDVSGELSELEAELAALPSAPAGRAKESERAFAEAV